MVLPWDARFNKHSTYMVHSFACVVSTFSALTADSTECAGKPSQTPKSALATANHQRQMLSTQYDDNRTLSCCNGA